MFHDDLPDQIPVNFKVVMDQPVSGSDDVPPGDFGVLLFQFLREFGCGFANDFQPSEHGVLDLVGFQEVFFGKVGSIDADVVNAVQDVVNIDLGIFLQKRGICSFKMPSSTMGWSLVL